MTTRNERLVAAWDSDFGDGCEPSPEDIIDQWPVIAADYPGGWAQVAVDVAPVLPDEAPPEPDPAAISRAGVMTRWKPGIPPPELEFAIELSPSDADIVVRALRGEVHRQIAGEEDYSWLAATIPLPGSGAWSGEIPFVADKI